MGLASAASAPGGSHDTRLEVRIGNAKVADPRRQIFGLVVGEGTDIAVLIRRQVLAASRTDGTDVVCFTDGCPGLRSAPAKESLPKRPIGAPGRRHPNNVTIPLRSQRHVPNAITTVRIRLARLLVRGAAALPLLRAQPPM